MMLSWTKHALDTLENLLEGEPHAIEALKALLLELLVKRHPRALFARHRLDAWPVVLMGVQMQLMIEYDPDGIALSIAGILPSHRKDRRYIGDARSVPSAGMPYPNNISVTCVDVDTAREYVRDAIAAAYPLPRF